MKKAGNRLMKVIVNNLATEYKKTGRGPVILMLHGWCDNLHTFDKIAEDLKSEYTILSLDMPGFGQTEMPPKTWEVSDYVDFISNFLNKLEINPYCILGHSFGGRVTIKGVSTRVFKPKKIILIGSAGISKRVTLRNIAVLILTKIFGIITLIPPLLFYRHKIRKKAYKIIGSDYLESNALKDTYIKIISEDLKSYAKSINVPTQLIWGSNDTETPLEDGKIYNSLINNSKLRVIKNSGHLVHQQEPHEVSQTIKEFLK
ncbi:MAG: alpha/beta hydrolase [Bacteroidetes bacterium]|nr:alpha/beta hydrolase [Bacteroidota bacterium]